MTKKKSIKVSNAILLKSIHLCQNIFSIYYAPVEHVFCKIEIFKNHSDWYQKFYHDEKLLSVVAFKYNIINTYKHNIFYTPIHNGILSKIIKRHGKKLFSIIYCYECNNIEKFKLLYLNRFYSGK